MFKKNVNLIPVVLMSILTIAMTVFGQESEKTVNPFMLFQPWIRIVITCMLGIWFVLKIIGVFVQPDRKHNWWGIVMIPAVIIFINQFENIYYAISNSKISFTLLYYLGLFVIVLVLLKSIYKWFFDKK